MTAAGIGGKRIDSCNEKLIFIEIGLNNVQQQYILSDKSETFQDTQLLITNDLTVPHKIKLRDGQRRALA